MPLRRDKIRRPLALADLVVVVVVVVVEDSVAATGLVVVDSRVLVGVGLVVDRSVAHLVTMEDDDHGGGSIPFRCSKTCFRAAKREEDSEEEGEDRNISDNNINNEDQNSKNIPTSSPREKAASLDWENQSFPTRTAITCGWSCFMPTTTRSRERSAKASRNWPHKLIYHTRWEPSIAKNRRHRLRRGGEEVNNSVPQRESLSVRPVVFRRLPWW
mmetsp:Transcript_41089/g.85952  ORF Transcript_41089/g.85952 Transcript_41089/m.85952 type:complete len:215 (-) Transcript_41089:2443-3087(-)